MRFRSDGVEEAVEGEVEAFAAYSLLEDAGLPWVRLAEAFEHTQLVVLADPSLVHCMELVQGRVLDDWLVEISEE